MSTMWNEPLMPTGWDRVDRQLLCEIDTLEYTGVRVPDALKREAAALQQAAREGAPPEVAFRDLYRQLAALPENPEWRRRHPDELAEIRRLRPDGKRRLPVALSPDALLDRLHGAWVGRAAGCALGKPVEGIGLAGRDGLPGWECLERYLRCRGEWPLSDYFPGTPAGDGVTLDFPACWRDNICEMIADDDMQYMMVALLVLEKHGSDFRWHDVADMWNTCLPYNAICTAETQAILNYNRIRPRSGGANDSWTGRMEFVRRFNNPYREWIGAMIRADVWGYAAPGEPEIAAEAAWRDAAWTHCGNGIYGAMYVAAMIAAAFAVDTVDEAVAIGLEEIPAESRLADELREVRQWFREGISWDVGVERLHRRFRDWNGVHVLNNALLVTWALYCGAGDLEKSICLAVSGGWDTDCNGATVGSVVGALRGAKATAGRMTAALHDTLTPGVIGCGRLRLRDLAERTLRVRFPAGAQRCSELETSGQRKLA